MIPAAIVAEDVMVRAAAVAMAGIVMAAAAVTNAADMEAAVNLLLLLLFPTRQSPERQKEMDPECLIIFQEHACMHLIK